MSRTLPPDDTRGGWSQPASETDTPTPGVAPTRYTLGGLVGRGGMGRVSVAHDRTLGREVAFKELDPGLASDAAARRRMAREVSITARLDHQIGRAHV